MSEGRNRSQNFSHKCTRGEEEYTNKIRGDKDEVSITRCADYPFFPPHSTNINHTLCPLCRYRFELHPVDCLNRFPSAYSSRRGKIFFSHWWILIFLNHVHLATRVSSLQSCLETHSKKKQANQKPFFFFSNLVERRAIPATDDLLKRVVSAVRQSDIIWKLGLCKRLVKIFEVRLDLLLSSSSSSGWDL